MTSWVYSLKKWPCSVPRACSKGLRPDEDTTMRPFDGLKVLDFFWVVIGPMTTSYLAEEGVSHVLGLSESLSKLIAIDKQPNHQIVHLFRLRKTNRAAH